MAYLQMKGILEQTEKLRHYLCEYTERRESETDNEFLAGFYRDLRNDVQRLTKTTAEFVEHDHDQLLETWIQYPGTEPLEEAMERLSDSSQQEHQEVLQSVLEAEERVLECFQQAQQQTTAEENQEGIGQLVDLQEHHLRHTAKNITTLEQMLRVG